MSVKQTFSADTANNYRLRSFDNHGMSRPLPIQLRHRRDPYQEEHNTTVDATRLLNAWQQVVQRQSALRTVFFDSACRDGKFDQAVLKAPKSKAFSSQCDDWKELGEVSKKQSGSKGPKLPSVLVVGSAPDGKVYLRLEMNHAVIDSASTVLLILDLSRAYDDTLPKEPAMPYSE